MNPCLCGNYGIEGRQCICSASSVINYQRKLSGPIIDRIDLWTEVSITDHEQLLLKNSGEETSQTIQQRVIQARVIQTRRFGTEKTNSEMTVEDISQYVHIKPDAQKILIDFCTKFNLSARAHHRIIKVAQTICDLQEKTSIDVEAVLEALQYRPKRGIRMD